MAEAKQNSHGKKHGEHGILISGYPHDSSSQHILGFTYRAGREQKKLLDTDLHRSSRIRHYRKAAGRSQSPAESVLISADPCPYFSVTHDVAVT